MQRVGTSEFKESQVDEVGVDHHGEQHHGQLQQRVQTEEDCTGHHGDHTTQNKDLRRTGRWGCFDVALVTEDDRLAVSPQDSCRR